MFKKINLALPIVVVLVLSSCGGSGNQEAETANTANMEVLENPTGLNGNKIVLWGPQGFTLGGQIPNILSDGKMGMYFELSNHSELDGIDVQFGELVVPTVNGGNGVLTASVDLTGITDSKNITVSLIHKKQNVTLPVGEFKVIK